MGDSFVRLRQRLQRSTTEPSLSHPARKASQNDSVLIAGVSPPPNRARICIFAPPGCRPSVPEFRLRKRLREATRRTNATRPDNAMRVHRESQLFMSLQTVAPERRTGILENTTRTDEAQPLVHVMRDELT